MSAPSDRPLPPVEKKQAKLELLGRIRREGGDEQEVAAQRLLAEIDLQLCQADPRQESPRRD